MILFCGFNGFQQFLALCPNYDKELSNDIIPEFFYFNIPSDDVILCATCSEILFIKNNTIKVCGFSALGPGKCISLVNPFKERIIQASINKEGYIFVCESGKVWLCSANDNSWKNMTHLFSTDLILNSEKIVKVSCGETMTAAISNSGVAYCVPNSFPEIRGIKDVACGKEHGILLTESGTVLTWGGGSRGQLGCGELEGCEKPSEVEALSGLQVVRIAAGGWHSAALTDQGDLYTWGWNNQGQLGFPLLTDGVEGSVSVSAIPMCVELPEDALIEDVSCGASHTVIKLKDGSVLGCGWNKWGQLGLSQTQRSPLMTLLPISPETSVKSIICGAWSTFILA